MTANMLLSFAVICVIYGILLRVFRAGTRFYPVWFCIAAGVAAAGACLRSGLWAGLSPAQRCCVTLPVLLVLLCVVGMLGMFLTGFFRKGKPGLDYIIVLGAQVRARGPSIALRYRLERALEYLTQNPDTICVVSGGRGPEEPWAEAEGMAAYLLEKGVPQSRILLEPDSTSTLENLRFSMDLLPEGASVGVITNNFHVFRAMQLCRLLGYSEAVGIAAGATPWFLPNNLLRECFGEGKLLLQVLGGRFS